MPLLASHNPHRVPLVAAVLCLCLGGTAPGAVETALTGPPAATRELPEEAMLIHAEGDWLIWGERDEAKRMFPRDPAVNRIYRQRINGADTRLLLEQADPTRLAVWGVLADGTTLIYREDMYHHRALLVTVDSLGRSTTRELVVPDHETQVFFTLAATPRGAIIQPVRTRADDRSPLLFVPFEQGRVVEAATVGLSIHGPVRPFPHRPVAHHGGELCWSDDDGVYILDLATRTLREVPINPEDGLLPNHSVRGFDGKLIVLSSGVIDAQSGELLGRAEQLDPAVMRDGIGYFLVPHRLEAGKPAPRMALRAVPILGGEARTLALVDAFTPRVGSGVFATRYRSGHPYVTETELGVRIFNGKQTTIVPFLDPADHQ